MNTRCDPRELIDQLIPRSSCTVQVAAVIEDAYGIAGWGWNSMGPSGYGMHAEDHCLLRTNRKRWEGATIYVGARRLRNGKIVGSKPCEDCQRLIEAAEIGKVIWRDSDGEWRLL